MATTNSSLWSTWMMAYAWETMSRRKERRVVHFSFIIGLIAVDQLYSIPIVIIIYG